MQCHAHASQKPQPCPLRLGKVMLLDSDAIKAIGAIWEIEEIEEMGKLGKLGKFWKLGERGVRVAREGGHGEIVAMLEAAGAKE